MRHDNLNAMKSVVKGYFENLFTAEVHDVDESVFADVQRKVSRSMNQHLMSPFSPEEVKKALFSIGDHKAP